MYGLRISKWNAGVNSFLLRCHFSPLLNNRPSPAKIPVHNYYKNIIFNIFILFYLVISNSQYVVAAYRATAEISPIFRSSSYSRCTWEFSSSCPDERQRLLDETAEIWTWKFDCRISPIGRLDIWDQLPSDLETVCDKHCIFNSAVLCGIYLTRGSGGT